MRFVFPQNYNFNNKLFGFIDYSNITLKIIFFIILFFTFCLLSIIGFNHEKILYIFIYLFKYIISPKIYLFKKY